MTVHYSKMNPKPEPIKASPLIVQHLMFRLDKAQRLMMQAEDELTLVRKFLEEMEAER